MLDSRESREGRQIKIEYSVPPTLIWERNKLTEFSFNSRVSLNQIKSVQLQFCDAGLVSILRYGVSLHPQVGYYRKCPLTIAECVWVV